MSEHFDEHHHHQHDGDHNPDNQHHHDGSSDQHSSSGESTSTQNDNGYVVVPPTPQSSVADDMNNQVSSSSSQPSQQLVENVLDLLTHSMPEQQEQQQRNEDIKRMLSEISSSAEAKLSSLTETIRAEADSSSSVAQEKPNQPQKEAPPASCSLNANFLCPYYVMAMNRLNKMEVPPRVKDLLLWRNPKLTGAVFGSSFVLLVSIACFSLLTVISALFLTALTLIGSYRFYLALIFRIKGTYDNTFDKLSSQDISLPKDKVQNFTRLLETDLNRTLNKLKSILLWDNITTSAIAFFVFYVVYCIGCMFNTITLLILILVKLFTLPKIYEVYKQPIDQTLEKVTSMAHQTVKQIMKKVPMLNKKKTQ